MVSISIESNVIESIYKHDRFYWIFSFVCLFVCLLVHVFYLEHRKCDFCAFKIKNEHVAQCHANNLIMHFPSTNRLKRVEITDVYCLKFWWNEKANKFSFEWTNWMNASIYFMVKWSRDLYGFLCVCKCREILKQYWIMTSMCGPVNLYTGSTNS